MSKKLAHICWNCNPATRYDILDVFERDLVTLGSVCGQSLFLSYNSSILADSLPQPAHSRHSQASGLTISLDWGV